MKKYYYGVLVVYLAACAPVPEAIQSQHHFDAYQMDYYRRNLARGRTPEEAAAWVLSPEGSRRVSSERYYKQAEQCYGGFSLFGKSDLMKKHTQIALEIDQGVRAPVPFICDKAS